MPDTKKQWKEEVPGMYPTKPLLTQRTITIAVNLLSQENGARQCDAVSRTNTCQGPRTLFGLHRALFCPDLQPQGAGLCYKNIVFLTSADWLGVSTWPIWSQSKSILKNLGPGTEQERVLRL